MAAQKYVQNSCRKQVGNLSAHALHFARFKRKRLEASKYSNLIFERFICVFASFFLLTKKLLIHCIVGKARKV
jgi:hypothetical protein